MVWSVCARALLVKHIQLQVRMRIPHMCVFVFVAYRAYIGGTSAPQGSSKEHKHSQEKAHVCICVSVCVSVFVVILTGILARHWC